MIKLFLIILSLICVSRLYGASPEPITSEATPEFSELREGLSSPYDLDNPSEDDKYFYWILYKDYPYVENALITEEQLEALRYFENFGYDYITAKNTNRAIKFIEQYFVKMRLRK